MSGNNKERSHVSVKKGVYLTLIVIAAIVAAVLLNVVVGKLPASLTKLDLTDTGTFGLTIQTRQICKNLDEDVHFYLIVNSKEMSTDVQYIQQLMERYTSLSDHIKIDQVDPSLSPDFVPKYTAASLTSGSVIADGPKRSKVITQEEIFYYDQLEYAQTGEVNLQFRGEEALTAAITFVTSDKVPIVYVTQGHGELVPGEKIVSYISAENYEITEISLLAAGNFTAEDIDCVISNAPSTDFSAPEIEILKNYLASGGSFYLLTNYNSLVNLPNLLSIMSEYGLTPVEGFVIDSDPSYCYSGRPYMVMPETEYHESTEPLYYNALRVIMRMPHGIKIAVDLPDGVTAYPLLLTSKSAISKIAEEIKTLEKEEGDVTGPFYLGAVATKGNSRIIWFGSADLTGDDMDSVVSGTNRDMFINGLAWVSEWEQTISIRSTKVGGGKLAPTDLQMIAWGVVFPALIIIVVVIIGLVVWLKRRKR